MVASSRAAVQVRQEHRPDVAERAAQFKAARHVLRLLRLARELDEAEIRIDAIRIAGYLFARSPAELRGPDKGPTVAVLGHDVAVVLQRIAEVEGPVVEPAG